MKKAQGCICSMHSKCGATVVHTVGKPLPPQLHLRDALKVRCYLGHDDGTGECCGLHLRDALKVHCYTNWLS